MTASSPFDRFMASGPVRMLADGVRPARRAALAAAMGIAVMTGAPADVRADTSLSAAQTEPAVAVFAVARPADGARFDTQMADKHYVRAFVDGQRPGLVEDSRHGSVYRPVEESAPIAAMALSHNLSAAEALSAVRRAGVSSGTIAALDIHPDLIARTAAEPIDVIAARLGVDVARNDGLSSARKADLTTRLADPFDRPAAVAVAGELLAMKAMREGDMKAAGAHAASSFVGMTAVARMAEREAVPFSRAEPVAFFRRGDHDDQR